jgi:hypothetical protein
MRLLPILILAFIALACQKTIHEVRQPPDHAERTSVASARP